MKLKIRDTKMKLVLFTSTSIEASDTGNRKMTSVAGEVDSGKWTHGPRALFQGTRSVTCK